MFYYIFKGATPKTRLPRSSGGSQLSWSSRWPSIVWHFWALLLQPYPGQLLDNCFGVFVRGLPDLSAAQRSKSIMMKFAEDRVDNTGACKNGPESDKESMFYYKKYMTTYSDRWTFRITIIKETGNYGNTWPCWIRSIIVYNFTAHLFEITELSTPLQVDYGRLSWKDLTHSGRRLL